MRRGKAGQLDLPLRYRQLQAVGRAHLALDGKLVTYTIKRSLRRSAISILVDEEGLRVGAPWDATPHAIERLLQKHGDWVLRKLDEWQVRRAPPRRWVDGEPLMLLGEPFRLHIVPAATHIRIAGDELVVGAPHSTSSSVSRQVLEWLHAQALECYRMRVDHYRRLLRVERNPQVLLSSARTRWGSCHSNGRIHLNWRLVQMPLRLVDYVVAHEVAHLLEMNHSQRFWRAVGRLVPDYAARRSEIRREGHRYLLI
jgi:predicted metal-dependent hydrolase